MCFLLAKLTSEWWRSVAESDCLSEPMIIEVTTHGTLHHNAVDLYQMGYVSYNVTRILTVEQQTHSTSTLTVPLLPCLLNFVNSNMLDH